MIRHPSAKNPCSTHFRGFEVALIDINVNEWDQKDIKIDIFV